METKTIIPSPLTQYLNPYMLDPLLGILAHVEKKIIPHAFKKIRPQDVGKQREFDKLKIKFMETYERKKAEEKEYNEKIKNAAKRSSFPASSATVKFTKFQSKE